MKTLKLISKIGILFAVSLILLVSIVESSFRAKEFNFIGWTINTSQLGDGIFVIALVVMVVSLLLRVLSSEKQWNGVVSFSKYFVPVAVVFYGLAVFLEGENQGTLGGPSHWIGISLAIIYGMALLCFASKTFFDKW